MPPCPKVLPRLPRFCGAVRRSAGIRKAALFPAITENTPVIVQGDIFMDIKISLTVLDAFQEFCCTEKSKEGFPDLFTARSAVVRGKSFSFILL